MRFLDFSVRKCRQRHRFRDGGRHGNHRNFFSNLSLGVYQVGDRFDVRIPALADRRITVQVKLIATKGEYASWRATRATGDFVLRTFSIRAYPVDKVPELRPGMSAYLDWQARG